MTKNRERMTKISTQNDVVQFIYDESNGTQKKAQHAAILSNDKMLDEFYELESIKHELDKVEYKPSSRSLGSIMNYATSEPVL